MTTFWLMAILWVVIMALTAATIWMTYEGEWHTCLFTNCDQHYQGERFRGPHRTPVTRRKHYEG